MVEIPKHKLPVTKPEEYPDTTRVRLKGDRTSVYTHARAHSEGWIRARKYDPNGAYPLVFIEWDEQHWSYNGQDNMWTFEDHFEPIEDNQVSEDTETIRLLKVIAGKLGADDEPTPSQGKLEAVPEPEPTHDPDIEAGYTETLKEALAAARKGDSFLLVTVSRETGASGRDILVPQIFKGEKAEDASLLVNLHVSQVGAMLHRELAVERIEEILDENNPEPPNLVA